MVSSECKLKWNGKYGNGHTKVLMEQAGYFESKVSEAISEEELKDMS